MNAWLLFHVDFVLVTRNSSKLLSIQRWRCTMFRLSRMLYFVCWNMWLLSNNIDRIVSWCLLSQTRRKSSTKTLFSLKITSNFFCFFFFFFSRSNSLMSSRVKRVATENVVPYVFDRWNSIEVSRFCRFQCGGTACICAPTDVSTVNCLCCSCEQQYPQQPLYNNRWFSSWTKTLEQSTTICFNENLFFFSWPTKKNARRMFFTKIFVSLQIPKKLENDVVYGRLFSYSSE